MSDSELKVCVNEIYRVLKKGWYAFITFPAKENLIQNTCKCPQCWYIFHRWWHKQYWDKEKIHKIFKDFQIIKIKEFFNRYQWATWIEYIIWYMFFIARNILNKFIDLENKSYLVILRKPK